LVGKYYILFGRQIFSGNIKVLLFEDDYK
jgi:hypothetical protein